MLYQIFYSFHQNRSLTGDGFISADLAIFGVQMSSGRLVFGLGTLFYIKNYGLAFCFRPSHLNHQEIQGHSPLHKTVMVNIVHQMMHGLQS